MEESSDDYDYQQHVRAVGPSYLPAPADSLWVANELRKSQHVHVLADGEIGRGIPNVDMDLTAEAQAALDALENAELFSGGDESDGSGEGEFDDFVSQFATDADMARRIKWGEIQDAPVRVFKATGSDLERMRLKDELGNVSDSEYEDFGSIDDSCPELDNCEESNKEPMSKAQARLDEEFECFLRKREHQDGGKEEISSYSEEEDSLDDIFCSNTKSDTDYLYESSDECDGLDGADLDEDYLATGDGINKWDKFGRKQIKLLGDVQDDDLVKIGWGNRVAKGEITANIKTQVNRTSSDFENPVRFEVREATEPVKDWSAAIPAYENLPKKIGVSKKKKKIL